MLYFLYSKLLHPNIVLLMGVCIEVPDLCLITEFMQMGSVREILDNHSVELKWRTTFIMVSIISLLLHLY